MKRCITCLCWISLVVVGYVYNKGTCIVGYICLLLVMLTTEGRAQWIYDSFVQGAVGLLLVMFAIEGRA